MAAKKRTTKSKSTSKTVQKTLGSAPRTKKGGGRTRGGRPIYSMSTYTDEETRVVQVYKK